MNNDLSIGYFFRFSLKSIASFLYPHSPPAHFTDPIFLPFKKHYQFKILYLLYLEQKEIQKRTRFIEDPLTKCPDLPKNPEDWTQDHVRAFMRGTDLAQYADTLKEEVCLIF